MSATIFPQGRQASGWTNDGDDDTIIKPHVKYPRQTSLKILFYYKMWQVWQIHRSRSAAQLPLNASNIANIKNFVACSRFSSFALNLVIVGETTCLWRKSLPATTAVNVLSFVLIIVVHKSLHLHYRQATVQCRLIYITKRTKRAAVVIIKKNNRKTL